MVKCTIALFLPFAIAVTACSGSGSSSSQLAVDVSPALAARVEITAQDWHQPAPNEASVEVVIHVHNTSSDTVVFNAVGAWSTASGAGRGGLSSEYTVFVDQGVDIVLGTRSPDVARLILELREGPIPPQVAEAPTPDPSVCAHEPTATSRLAMRGVVGQRAFRPGSITFLNDRREPGGKWWVEFSDGDIDELVDLAIWEDRRQTLHLDLEHEPRSHASFEHGFGPGGGYFQILASDDAARTTSWNTANAWKMVVEDWSYDPSTLGDELAGTATGRIEICYPGSGGIPTSSLIGAFTGARIFIIHGE